MILQILGIICVAADLPKPPPFAAEPSKEIQVTTTVPALPIARSGSRPKLTFRDGTRPENLTIPEGAQEACYNTRCGMPLLTPK